MVSSFLFCSLFMSNTQQTTTHTPLESYRKMYKLVECWVWTGVNDQAGRGSSTGTTCDPTLQCTPELHLTTIATWVSERSPMAQGISTWHLPQLHWGWQCGVGVDASRRETHEEKRYLPPEEDAVHHGVVTNVKSATQSFNSSILETIRNHKLSTTTKQSKTIKNQNLWQSYNHLFTKNVLLWAICVFSDWAKEELRELQQTLCIWNFKKIGNIWTKSFSVYFHELTFCTNILLFHWFTEEVGFLSHGTLLDKQKMSVICKIFGR